MPATRAPIFFGRGPPANVFGQRPMVVEEWWPRMGRAVALACPPGRDVIPHWAVAFVVSSEVIKSL